MARKQKKYHYIYKTTNLLNGKYYIGMHSTDNLEDGYMGSGNRLRLAIRKHDKKNFKKEILEFLNSREELKEREKEIINLDELAKKDCMNLMVGGDGGFINKPNYYENLTHIGKKAFKEKLKDPEYKKKHGEKMTKVHLQISEKYNRKGEKPFCDWTGKKHTEETKKKIGEANSVKQKGKSNSQYGTCWITDGKVNKKIKKEDFWKYIIPNGLWKYGRTKTKSELENTNKSNSKRRKVKRPPYEQLIKEIEEFGLTGTGREYGVTYGAIKKWKIHHEKYL